MSVVGKSGLHNTGQFSNLVKDDKRSLEVNNVLKGIAVKNLDLEKAMPITPKLELEIKDAFTASTISFKFVALKTANNWAPKI